MNPPDARSARARAHHAAAPAAWHLLVTSPASGAENMALDEALMRRALDEDAAILRVYEWREPTLSLGRHQTAHGRYDLAAAAERGVRFVRRPTGGRALLHHREVTYSVTAPERLLGSLAESYARINRLLVGALARLGVSAVVAAAAGPAPRPGVAPCFAEPVAGEVTAGGRKLVGSAQWRDRGAILQHGSILVDDDQALASALLREPAPPPPAPATLRELLGRAPRAMEVADAMAAELEASDGAAPQAMQVDAALGAAARALTARYLSDEWTWRR